MVTLKFLQRHSNPLETVLQELGTNPQPVTLSFLDWIVQTLAVYKYYCQTYGDAIEFLEYMETNNLVELVKNDKTGTYTIKRIVTNKNE